MATINYREMFIKKIIEKYGKDETEFNCNLRKKLKDYNLMELKKYSEEIQNE